MGVVKSAIVCVNILAKPNIEYLVTMHNAFFLVYFYVGDFERDNIYLESCLRGLFYLIKALFSLRMLLTHINEMKS